MNRILKYYEDLPIKYKILVLIVICIVLIILIRLMNYEDVSNQYTKNLNYKEITIQSLLENYKENYNNRDDYLVLKDIVEQYKKIYNGDSKVYKEYYETLDSNYSKKISKGKFIEKINSIFSKANELGNDYNINMYSTSLSSNTYIVELIDNEEVIGYIGIILDKTSSTYSIFYVE